MTLLLTGLTAAPAQVCGGIRLVPLLQGAPCLDVRLERKPFDADLTVVQTSEKIAYWAFVPHGLVLHWDIENEEVEVAQGSQLLRADSKKSKYGWGKVQILHRMARRVDKKALRFLPLHTALEGFLALHFGGPNLKWPEYSGFALSHGLGSRTEWVHPGGSIYGFEQALRTFEIYQGQVGVMIYVVGALASVSVFPSPQDYRRLHSTLLEDVYGELIWQYALMHTQAQRLENLPRVENAKTLADLRAALNLARTEEAQFSLEVMSGDLIGRELRLEKVYAPGNLLLERFITDLNPDLPNHIGERLTRENGEVLYLKTFLLSSVQVRRARLLLNLAVQDWHLERAAAALKLSLKQLVLEFETLGFGYLLKPHVLEAAHRR